MLANHIKIQYSFDKEFYFIVDVEQNLPKYWLSVEQFEEEPDLKSPRIFLFGGDYILYKLDRDYYRIYYMFNHYRIQSGVSEEIIKDHKLYRDYSILEEWG